MVQLFTPLLLAASATLSIAAPSSKLFKRSTDHHTKRATCTPTSAGSASTDDVPAIKAAITSCGAGGIIQIAAGKTYQVHSVLDFAGCADCDFQIEGTLKVSDNTTFWNGKPNVINLSGITGAKIRSVTGAGLLDGNGQKSWDLFAEDSSYDRPTLVSIGGSSKNVAVSNLKIKNAPNVFFSINSNAANTAFTSLTLTAISSSSNLPKNTDGFDVGPATYTTFKNITVTNDDDCIAFKPGTDYCTVDTITCKGSHGISVGSLGNRAGRTDTVSNVYVTNADMQTSTKAVGIKLYPAGDSHGSAVVKNVTFDGITVTSSDYAAQIQSCYNEDAAYCASTPSTAQVTDVYFKNFKGVVSSKYAPTVANINCPGAGTCDVYFSDWSVTTPKGDARFLCANIDNAEPGVTCSSGASG
ncbi:glycoside hydrolase family 28 protein [Massarina eburnea CBS 473.64]|uniref:Glycoside hydrolase family 28 protein n=1 Tax=Massarina eburnea CBS 473.64 TaxID=1395130 RepID=A0A6A6RU89_9PLEO|nr:glycoside hydrolase family 28 protein [Massarina eburnea CBS 473.64]